MKKLLVISTLFVIMASCSKENKAEANISDYIKSKLDDPKSYESDSFGKLIPVKEELEGNPEFLKLIEKYKIQSNHELSMYSSFLRTDSIKHLETYKKSKEYYNEAKDSSEKILVTIEKFKKEFKPADMFTMTHKFRSNNKMGALVLDSCTAYLDKDLNVVYLK